MEINCQSIDPHSAPLFASGRTTFKHSSRTSLRTSASDSTLFHVHFSCTIDSHNDRSASGDQLHHVFVEGSRTGTPPPGHQVICQHSVRVLGLTVLEPPKSIALCSTLNLANKHIFHSAHCEHLLPTKSGDVLKMQILSEH